jgi:type IX secretion system PorP/SprF family membrane protein
MVVLILIVSSNIKAQQLPVFTQYMLNKYVFNPAVTGTEDHFTAIANYRYQWQGITDAPRTYILSVHGPHKYKNYGIGGALYTDVTGPTSRTGAYLSYAYYLKVKTDQKVSLGLSGGLMQYRVDGTKITLADPGDLVLANTLLTKFVPDFGFGAYWYSDKFYVGLSVPQFIQARVDFTDDSAQSLSKLTSHFYINAGYKYDINEEFAVEPSFMMRYSYPVIPQIDLGLKGLYQDMFYLGMLYRTQDAFSILAGYQTADEKFTFGYSYDITTSNLDLFSNGSHELMVKAKFGNIKSKAKKRKRKLSKLERLEQKLKELEEQENELDEQDGGELDTEPENTEDGDMDHYDDTKDDASDESSTDEPEKKPLEQQLAEVEQQDRELRAKVRSLRDEAEAQGYSSPNDPGFSKRQEYLDALDQIKDVYKKKKELDSLLD